ncbi:MAG: hypothetical protein ACOX7A_04470 [Lawsonibacter sp.]|jgi:hypothetical protein
MASNHTTNFELCQWQADDQVKRTDFNEDNAKIDSALKGLSDGLAAAQTEKADQSALDALAAEVAKKATTAALEALGAETANKADNAALNALDGRALRWATGSYTGTGTYGRDNPSQLDFSQTLKRPPVFLLVRCQSDNDTTKSPVLAALRGVTRCSVYPSLINTGGATCSMTWSGTAVQWYGSGAVQQMNGNGDQYFYLALG